MVVKIRLARFGRKNHPFYNIVVCQARYGRPVTPSSLSLADTFPPPPTERAEKWLLTPAAGQRDVLCRWR
jgi:hypothetical protein